MDGPTNKAILGVESSMSVAEEKKKDCYRGILGVGYKYCQFTFFAAYYTFATAIPNTGGSLSLRTWEEVKSTFERLLKRCR